MVDARGFPVIPEKTKSCDALCDLGRWTGRL